MYPRLCSTYECKVLASCFNGALNYVIWPTAFNTVHIKTNGKLEVFSTKTMQRWNHEWAPGTNKRCLLRADTDVLTVLWIMLSDELHLTQYTYQDKSTKILPRNWKRFRPQLRDAWEITLKLYLSVNVLSTKVLIGDTLFTSPTRLTGPPFYVVSRATRRSSRFQGKGSTFISQLLWDPDYWSSPGNRTRDLLLSNQTIYWLS